MEVFSPMQQHSQQKLRVVVAGGGTAGWMCAAALNKLMPHKVEVLLVESDQIGTIGVGEATIPTMQIFHRLLEIDEAEFMRETNATFKLGINFEGWKSTDSEYFHSFGMAGKDSWAGEFQHFWLRAKSIGIAKDFECYSLESLASKKSKFSKIAKPHLNYAYHLDATAYAKYLRRIAEKNGVTRVEGKIEAVNISPVDGAISGLSMSSGEMIQGDLFIDCTGFSGLLIEQALHTGYDDWSHYLPSDSAVAVQTEAAEGLCPYTRSIAHPFGWQWKIPLQHRVGNGLVYCSQYCSDEKAQATLLASVDGKPLTEPKLIRFKTGKRRKAWNKNCVAIGLSSGFLEPLESTSIHLISSAILRLIKLLPVGPNFTQESDEYNRQSDEEMSEIKDFIILHYYVNNRDDSDYWRFCNKMDIPETLMRRLNTYESSARIFRSPSELFTVSSWNQVMLGQGVEPKAYHPIADKMSAAELENYFEKMSGYLDHIVDQLPSHEKFIEQYCRSNQ